MDNQKFNEYKCTFKREGGKVVTDDNGAPVPETKELTKRGHVMITPQQAAHYNRRTAIASGILYIAATKKADMEVEEETEETEVKPVNKGGRPHKH